MGRAIFLLSVRQMKVRARLRGVLWQGAEVGSLFRQEMGWKTTGIQFFGDVITARDWLTYYGEAAAFQKGNTIYRRALLLGLMHLICVKPTSLTPHPVSLSLFPTQNGK